MWPACLFTRIRTYVLLALSGQHYSQVAPWYAGDLFFYAHSFPLLPAGYVVYRTPVPSVEKNLRRFTMAISYQMYQRNVARSEAKRKAMAAQAVEQPVVHNYHLVVPGVLESQPFTGTEKSLDRLLSRANLAQARRIDHGEYIEVVLVDKYGVFVA